MGFDGCESNGDIPKAQKLLLDSKNSSFLAKTPFLGRKIKFSTFFRKVAKWGVFNDCESNGDIPKAQKLLLDSKNGSFLAKTPLTFLSSKEPSCEFFFTISI